jgi:23S rRNA (guanosine2251-2'-O)-methyltransferase
VSTGAIETVRTIMVTNLTQTIETLKKHKFWVYGSEFTADAVDYRSIKYQGRVALVIGSEGKGISRLVLKNCDQVIKIPMYGEINSLNASVSAALLMYEVLNQRNPLI